MKWVSETDKKALRVARLVVRKALRITGLVVLVVLGFVTFFLVMHLYASRSNFKASLKASNASLVKKLGEAQTEIEWLCEVLITPEFRSLGSNAQGYEEFREERTGIVFVKLPGGTFQMGSPASEAERHDDEGPVHEVTLSSFLIAKHEVTQAQWRRVMGTSPSHFKGDDLPVESVSWNECQKFCMMTGLSLPTEAQWEYACRAGTTTAYHSGDTEADLAEFGWFYLNSGHKELPAGTEWNVDEVLGEWGCRTHQVGVKKPNGFGLHDMHGNVWEWCEDVYNRDYYSKAESRNGDKACRAGSGDRVSRGGGWSYGAGFCRSARRYGILPDSRDHYSGFRPLRPLP